MVAADGEDPDWLVKRYVEYRKEHEEESRALWEMTPAQRQAAMWRGELSRFQLFQWASRKPSEVPLINDEFAFITWNTDEYQDHLERLEREERGR